MRKRSMGGLAMRMGTIACLWALCVALVGCGGTASTEPTGDNSAADATNEATTSAEETSAKESTETQQEPQQTDPATVIPGTWETYEMVNGSETIRIDELDADRRAIAAQQYWVFDADGTATMVDESQSFRQSCTWELRDGDTIVLTYAEGDVSAQVMECGFDGETITMESDGIRMKMRKRA